MRLNSLTLISVCAGLTIAIGLVLAVLTVREHPADSRKLRKRLEVLEQLESLRQEQARRNAAVQTFTAIGYAATAPLADLAAAQLTNTPPEIKEHDARALTNGWTVRQADVVFNEVNLAGLPGFLHAAETQRPPWRLVECHITASRQRDGQGRVALTMETVSRRSP